jgi:hypothetical protein
MWVGRRRRLGSSGGVRDLELRVCDGMRFLHSVFLSRRGDRRGRGFPSCGEKAFSDLIAMWVPLAQAGVPVLSKREDSENLPRCGDGHGGVVPLPGLCDQSCNLRVGVGGVVSLDGRDGPFLVRVNMSPPFTASWTELA